MSSLCQTEITLDKQQFEDYWNYMAKKGRSFQTMQTYQRVLWQVYEFLPNSKTLNEDMLLSWEASMRSSGYSDKTIELQRSIFDRFLEFLAERNETGEDVPPSGRRTSLTREDYLQLLLAARNNGRKRAYMLVKTLVCTGIRSSELKDLTVEGLQEGHVWVTHYGIRRSVRIPEPLRSELMEYAEACGVTSGTLFITMGGTPLLHSAIWKEIKRVCRENGMEEEVGNPRNLYLLFLDTYMDVCQAGNDEKGFIKYQKLLSDEEALTAWDKQTITSEER